jgi:hypothetical protein
LFPITARSWAFIGDRETNRAPASLEQEAAPMQRRSFKNTLTFPDRLAKAAKRFREEADTKPPGLERDELLRKARLADTAAHIDQWISSPGLQPPT